MWLKTYALVITVAFGFLFGRSVLAPELAKAIEVEGAVTVELQTPSRAAEMVIQDEYGNIEARRVTAWVGTDFSLIEMLSNYTPEGEPQLVMLRLGPETDQALDYAYWGTIDGQNIEQQQVFLGGRGKSSGRYYYDLDMDGILDMYVEKDSWATFVLVNQKFLRTETDSETVRRNLVATVPELTPNSSLEFREGSWASIPQ